MLMDRVPQPMDSLPRPGYADLVSHKFHGSQQGFTIVELMIAMVLSLFLLGAITYVVVNSNKNYNTTDSLSRLQENARFAMDIVTRDLRRGGHAGCLGRFAGINNDLLGTAYGKVVATAYNIDYMISHVDGIENVGGGTTTWSQSGQSYLPGNAMALTDSPAAQAVVAGSDAIAVRYVAADDFIKDPASTIDLAQDMDSLTADVVISNSTNAAKAIKEGDIVIVSNCATADIFQVKAVTPSGATIALNHSAGRLPSPKPGPGNASDSLQAKYTAANPIIPTTASTILNISAVAYFVATNTATGQRSLYRQTPAGGSQEVVEGVDSLQIQYGVADTSKGAPYYATRYVSADQLDSDDTTANPKWKNVVSVRLGLLVSTMANTATGQYGTDVETSSSTYQVVGQTVGPFTGERRLRRVFENTVFLRNPL